jgi:Bacterial PH domain
MNLLNNILGNATQINNQDVLPLIKDFLVNNEDIVVAYKLIRDTIIFTTERLVLIDVQGLTGSKMSFTSYPYSTIKSFRMENAGTFDMDAEIVLVLQGNGELSLKFSKGTDLKPIYRYLSTYILRDN